MKIKTTTAAAALALLSLPGQTKAAFLSIDDTNPDETITVSANDFEGGLVINGAAFQSGLGNPATGKFDETPNGISFSGNWLAPGLQPGNFIVMFTETDATGGQAISDVLRYSYSASAASGLGHIEGTFLSDVEGGPILDPIPGAIIWPESQGAYNFSAAFLTALANSDATVPDAGPGALGSLALLGICAAGTLKNLRRKSVA